MTLEPPKNKIQDLFGEQGILSIITILLRLTINLALKMKRRKDKKNCKKFSEGKQRVPLAKCRMQGDKMTKTKIFKL
jgi:hypothetical protein